MKIKRRRTSSVDRGNQRQNSTKTKVAAGDGNPERSPGAYCTDPGPSSAATAPDVY